MCLFEVMEMYEPNDNMIVAYKIYVRISRDGLRSSYRSGKYIIGQHYIAEKCDIFSSCKTLYESGFHAFINEEDAEKECCDWEHTVCEVHLWDIKVIGIQWGKKVVVADNIRIIRRV